MSIRYRCEECGAAFKIRDSLAGTRGKCPQCRIKFTVPNESILTEEEFAEAEQAARSVHESSPKLGDAASSGTLLEPASKPSLPSSPASPSSPKLSGARPSPPPPAPIPSSPPPADVTDSEEEPVAPEPEDAPADAAENEFDAADFLMDDSDPNARKTAGLAKQEAGPEKPATDALGRRYFGAGPKAAAAAKQAEAEDVGASVTTTAKLPQEAPRPKTDWKAVQKNLIRRSPLILVFAVLAGVTYFMSSRYLAPRPEWPVLSVVSGKALVNGKPLSNVIIHLTAINATQATSANGSKIRLADAVGLVDAEGNYRLSYLNQPGAPRGKSRVWFEPLTPADYKRIPTRLQTAGSEIRDVREAGNEGGKFDFDFKME